MKRLQQVCAVSALSLAVSGAYAAPSGDCNSLNDVNDLSYWSNPAMLLVCVLGGDAPAAGDGSGRPDTVAVTFINRTLGRNESDTFDPLVVAIQAERGSESSGRRQTEVVDLTEGVDLTEDVESTEDVARHIVLPTYEDGAPVIYSLWQTTEGGVVKSINVGTMSVDIVDNVDPSTDEISYQKYNSDGDNVDSVSFSAGMASVETVFDESVGPRIEVSVREGQGATGVVREQTVEIGDTITGEGTYKNRQDVTYFSGTEVFADLSPEEQLLLNLWSGAHGSLEESGVWLCSGGGCNDTLLESEEVNSVYIGGDSTPLADLQSLVASNVQAAYYGLTFLGKGFQMEADFGNKIASGSFTGGVGTDFSFEGVIQGADVISTSVFSSDPDVIGDVQGTFLGSQAIGIVGGYAIEADGIKQADLFFGAREVALDKLRKL